MFDTLGIQWPKLIAQFVDFAIVLFVLDLLLRRVRLFDRKKTARAPIPRWLAA